MAGTSFSRFAPARLAATGLAVLALAGPAAALDLPFGLGGGGNDRARVEAAPAPVRMAQVGDGGVRISQMEEEMRRLTGKVEELSFLVLQLQEQLRKSQEDNEFRFQDLEKASSGGGGGGQSAAPQRRSEAQPAATPQAEAASRVASATPSTMNDGHAGSDRDGDEIGAILGQSLGQGFDTQSLPQAPAGGAAGSTQVASVRTEGPGELYGLGYNYMLSGDYALAEDTFRQYTQAYPNSSDAPDAQYWLGESLYAQSKYREAAEVFLNAQKAHPKVSKAPEMMLKLGMSLVHLDNRETACITYAEIGKRYPEMSANVKRKVQAEEKSARCTS